MFVANCVNWVKKFNAVCICIKAHCQGETGDDNISCFLTSGCYKYIILSML